MKNLPTPFLLSCLIPFVPACDDDVDAFDIEEPENAPDLRFDEQPEFAEGEIGETLWDFGEGLTSIGYRVANGWVMVGGDMGIATASDARAKLRGLESRANIWSNNMTGWPGNRIDYHIDEDVGLEDQKAIAGAINAWEAKTPFRFEQHDNVSAGVHTLVFENKNAFPGAAACQAMGVGTPAAECTTRTSTPRSTEKRPYWRSGALTIPARAAVWAGARFERATPQERFEPTTGRIQRPFASRISARRGVSSPTPMRWSPPATP